MLDCVSLELENHDLMSGEESSDYDASFHEATDLDIVGCRKHSLRIRKLYYSLLADQVPVSKIAKIIQSALKGFHPSLNVTKD